MRGLQFEEGDEGRAYLRLVGGWEVVLVIGLRQNLERMKKQPSLPPIPDDDPE